ncbi:hypothetical protein BC939DRAFT_525224 [Gamsiella multidivaricata]|uniref:uncharacterized protein n=1 Tax=Gamsiella multidivaricata TaxID=101098 RepID=UPI0022207764|nr:uncharacterized protein BC939DRAFT_525224 [Gamsiella multidivaricata]KAG0370242.1 hypothetical protein BGZ54_007143 [Gamsiella multidivaricata]KAI7831172.1 hypothetical protein BC939DRAFT_525224 [Gamsiella multidivaricata]
MDRNKTPISTPERATKQAASDTPRASNSPRTPRTPTASRTRTASIGRTSATAQTPSPSSRTGVHRSSVIGSSGNTLSTSNNTEKSVTTTPVYPESEVLLNSTVSNAGLQLSDIIPLDAKTVERIKSLEISLKQHRDAEERLKRDIRSTRHELVTSTEQHDKVMQMGRTQLRNLKRDLDKLQEQSLKNSGSLQQLWEIIRGLNDSLAAKDQELIKIKNRFQEMEQHRQEILKDREETEVEALQQLRAERDKLRVEYEEVMKITEEFPEISVQLKKMFKPETIESIKANIQKKDERIAELENMIAESKKVLGTEEQKAEALAHLFNKVYERRINIRADELNERLKHAEETERKRDQEANDALQEFLRLDQMSIEVEEKASGEEYQLLLDKEELSNLESALWSLRMELAQRRQIVVSNM